MLKFGSTFGCRCRSLPGLPALLAALHNVIPDGNVDMQRKAGESMRLCDKPTFPPCSPAHPPIHPPLPFPAAVKTFSRLRVTTFPDGASQRQNRARAPSRSDAMVWCFIHFGVPVFRTEAGGVLCKTNVGGEAASDGRFTEGTVQLFRILYQKD